MTEATPHRRGRVASVAGIAFALLLAMAVPAAASHDDHTAGTVIVDLQPGADRVVVVHPLDVDRETAQEQLRAAADDAGLAVGDVEVGENSDPDTLRVRARVPMSTRQSALRYHAPAEHLDAWRSLGEVVVDTGRWSTVEGSVTPAPGQAVTYRVDPMVVVLGVAVLLGGALLPFLILRWYGARVVAAEEQPTADRVHRLRRATVAVQLITPLVLVAVLVGAGVADWPVLLLAELMSGGQLPSAVHRIVTMLAFLLPLLGAFVGAALGVLPYDRRLRDTDQSTRRGASQAARGAVLGMLPVLLWIAVLPMLPTEAGGWVIIPIALLFGLAVGAVMPLLIVWTQAKGELDEDVRRTVLAQCGESGLRVRDVKLLSSQGGRVANAAIAGVIPQLRYVFLTDELLERMDEEELRAVVAHEIGHGKGHHILIKMAAGFVALAAAAALLFLVLRPVLEGLPPLVIVLALPVLMMGALLFAHGVVGIKLEERADDHAAEQTTPAALARALETLAEANGTKRRTGWMWNVLQQHPGLDGRVKRLQQRSAGRDGMDVRQGGSDEGRHGIAGAIDARRGASARTGTGSTRHDGIDADQREARR